MRRIMLMLFAVGFLGSLAGCCCGGGSGGGHGFMHGICDCEEDNHCRDRSPWVQNMAPVGVGSEAVTVPPTRLPDGKKGL